MQQLLYSSSLVQHELLTHEARVLVVEGNDATRSLFSDAFAEDFYCVTAVSEAATACTLLADEAAKGLPFDLVVTELCSMDCDTTALLEVARSQPRAPAVILIGAASIDMVLTGLRLGAADYLTAPTTVADLQSSAATVLTRRQKMLQRSDLLDHIINGLGQLHNLARHQYDHSGASEETLAGHLTVGALTIDTQRHTIQWQGQSYPVTPIEYALLRYLEETPGHTRSYREIVRWTHGHTTSDTEAKLLLKSHARNLRRKLGPDLLVNVKGAGYVLKVDPNDSQRMHGQVVQHHQPRDS